MDEKEPTQRTPKGHEIPVPTREQIESDFAKIMQPVPDKAKKKRHGKRTDDAAARARARERSKEGE